MTMQLRPIVEGQVGTGQTLRDREVLGVRAGLRPTFSIREPLDETTISIRFAWQQTADMWVHSLRTDAGALIRSGQPLTASGVDLWTTVQWDLRMPGGQLWIAWGDLSPRSPVRFDWRGEARLYYRPTDLVGAVRGTDLELF